jgi:hypothetical protein
MTTLVRFVKSLIIMAAAILALTAVLVIVLFAWLDSLDLQTSGFQFG